MVARTTSRTRTSRNGRLRAAGGARNKDAGEKTASAAERLRTRLASYKPAASEAAQESPEAAIADAKPAAAKESPEPTTAGDKPPKQTRRATGGRGTAAAQEELHEASSAETVSEKTPPPTAAAPKARRRPGRAPQVAAKPPATDTGAPKGNRGSGGRKAAQAAAPAPPGAAPATSPSKTRARKGAEPHAAARTAAAAPATPTAPPTAAPAEISPEQGPRLIIAGASAYPRELDFAGFRAIADEVGAILMVDMAHYAGLIAAGVYPNPVPHAHVTTSTTHKTLRGPRGGIILTNDEGLAKKINSAVFPGNQGGPLMHVIAAKAVAFGEALQPSFREYAAAVIANARTLAATLKAGGLDIVSGGTDCHMVLVDLRPKGVKGRDAERALERAGLTCNKNAIPFDPEKPFVTSGVRLGTSAGTTRGFGQAEFARVGELVLRVVEALATAGPEGDPEVEAAVLAEVHALCAAFPIYAGSAR